MTKEEFLKDTLDYYSTDPSRRCKKDDVCAYSPKTIQHPNSKGCAIGRHLSASLAKKLDKENLQVNSHLIFYLLPKKLQLLGQGFLQDVQDIHDIDKYWSESSISNLGKQEVLRIINTHNLNMTYD